MLRKYLILVLFAVAAPLAANHQDYPVVPAGVHIAIQLQEPVESNGAYPGDTFAAIVANDVDVHGRTLIPSGAPARVELVADHQIAPGDPEVYAIELKSVQIDGNWFPVTTGFAESERDIRIVGPESQDDVPRGITSVDTVVDASAQGENAALATVQGAGVTFHVLHGPEVEAASGLTVYFTLAELLALRPEGAIK